MNVIYHIKLRKKIHMIMSVNTETVFDKLQHLFLIYRKNSHKTGNTGKLPQLIKQKCAKSLHLTLYFTVKD